MRHALIVAGAIACALASACRPHRDATWLGEHVELRIDSTEYTARPDGGVYSVKIDFAFTNRTGTTLSRSMCGAPSPPLLEKEVAPGRWVIAYSPVELMCETIPPFRIASGSTYRGVVSAYATTVAPGRLGGWQADSIPGTYRLHWGLHASAEPNDRAGTVSATSASFRIRRAM